MTTLRVPMCDYADTPRHNRKGLTMSRTMKIAAVLTTVALTAGLAGTSVAAADDGDRSNDARKVFRVR